MAELGLAGQGLAVVSLTGKVFADQLANSSLKSWENKAYACFIACGLYSVRSALVGPGLEQYAL